MVGVIAEMSYVPPDKPAAEFTRAERLELIAASAKAVEALGVYLLRLLELEGK